MTGFTVVPDSEARLRAELEEAREVVKSLQEDRKQLSVWHHPRCRKVIYDIKSSPCTCAGEFAQDMASMANFRAQAERLTSHEAELVKRIDQTNKSIRKARGETKRIQKSYDAAHALIMELRDKYQQEQTRSSELVRKLSRYSTNHHPRCYKVAYSVDSNPCTCETAYKEDARELARQKAVIFDLKGEREELHKHCENVEVGAAMLRAANNKLDEPVKQESEFNPDWDMLEATRASLRESWSRIRALEFELKQLQGKA